MRPSGIGGQAVIEGVMMKNKEKYAVAVRKPDNEIIVENREYHSISEKYHFLKLPILRGMVAFVESMIVGMGTLTFSASFFEEEEEVKKGKVEEAMGKIFKQKAETVMMGIMVVLSILFAVGIFMILPWFITELLKDKIQNIYLQAAIEGGLRLAIFVLYVFAISWSKDIRRVYMYHGAEHKTINCIENGCELHIENVKKQSRHHKRCGTSFMLYVMIISIVFFMFIRVDQTILRMLFRILLVPIVAGVSYEFIKLAGNSQSKIVGILSAPGIWLQRLTTREPDDLMIEVAIKSVEAVFDWKAYVQEEDLTKAAYGDMKEEIAVTEAPSKAVIKKADKSVRKGFEKKSSKVTKEATPKQVATLKKATTTRQALPIIEDVYKERGVVVEEEEDDVLSALDKFFVDETKEESGEQW